MLMHGGVSLCDSAFKIVRRMSTVRFYSIVHVHMVLCVLRRGAV
jgi:hypothetical protein